LPDEKNKPQDSDDSVHWADKIADIVRERAKTDPVLKDVVKRKATSSTTRKPRREKYTSAQAAAG